MANFFHDYFYTPLFGILVFIYQNITLHDLGIAIIVITLLVRVVLFPLFYKGAKDQALLQRLQPHIKKIQLDHKDNKEMQAKALMELYKSNKLNPFSGIVLLLVQLPVIIAIYQVFLRELSNPIFDNLLFLGLMNVGQKNIVLAIFAALLQYWQGKLSMPKQQNKSDNPMEMAGKMMVFMGPAFTLVILMNLPSALGLYWSVSTLFSVGQQLVINKKLEKTNPIDVPPHDSELQSAPRV